MDRLTGMEVFVRVVETRSFSGRRRRGVSVHQPLLISVPALASWRMTPSIGSNSPSHGAMARVSITCRAARPDSAGAEVDVFGMVLAIDSWRQQPHDMHSSETAILCETANFRCLAQLLRYLLHQFGYDVPKPVQLLLPSGMADGTARVLDVLLTI